MSEEEKLSSEELLEEESEQEETEEEEASETEEEDEGEEAEETEEDSEEEESEEDSEKPKGKDKRITHLLARAKKAEAKNAEARERMQFLETEIIRLQNEVENSKTNVKESFPPHKIGGKSIYEMSHKEFMKALSDVDAPPEQVQIVLRDRTAFEDSLSKTEDKSKEIAEVTAKFNREFEKNWGEEWALTTDLIREEYPKFSKKEFDAINKKVDELTRSKDPSDRLYWSNKAYQGGVSGKLLATQKAIELLGLDSKKEVSDKKPLQVVTRHQSGKKVSSTRTWTRAEIARMSNAEYAKHEAEIDKALAEGRIK